MSAESVVAIAQNENEIAESELLACSACNGVVRVGRGFVPPLPALYRALGHGKKPDARFPLTSKEVLSQEICGSSVDKKAYGKLFPTASTIGLMDRWRAENAQRRWVEEQKKRLEREEWEERVRQTRFEQEQMREAYRLKHLEEKEERAHRRRERDVAKQLRRLTMGATSPKVNLKKYGNEKKSLLTPKLLRPRRKGRRTRRATTKRTAGRAGTASASVSTSHGESAWTPFFVRIAQCDMVGA